MTEFPEYDEMRRLLDAYCEDRLLPAEMDLLEKMIDRRPEAEAFYVLYMSLNAELTQMAASAGTLNAEAIIRGRIDAEGDEDRRGIAPATQSSHRKSLRRMGPLAVTTASILVSLVVGVAARQWMPGESPQSTTVTEKRDAVPLSVVKAATATTLTNEDSGHPVAVLTNSVTALWRASASPFPVGSQLHAERLDLESGVAELQLNGGVKLLLEGPAVLELESAHAAHLVQGKLWVDGTQPDATFQLRTSPAILINHGGEYGIKVTPLLTDVQVLRGQLELALIARTQQSPSSRWLAAGQGLRMPNHLGETKLFATDCKEFVKPRDLAGYLSQSVYTAQQRHESWLKDMEHWKNESSLILHYTFQPSSGQESVVRNDSMVRDTLLDGKISGCKWTQGRWPGKHALQFNEPSDCISFSLPGEFENLTLATWVRIDRLKNRFSSIMMPDSWDEFEPHWHLSSNRGLELGVQGAGRKGWVHYHAKKAISPEQIGQWLHLAVTYDRDNGWVTHYVNGYPVMEEAIQLDVFLKIGNAELGNWNTRSQNHQHPIRHLCGAMDEFMIFARALSVAEVHDLYRCGTTSPLPSL